MRNTTLHSFPFFFFFFFLLSPLNHPLAVAAQSQSVTFTFPTFNLRNITLLGDSYIRNGVVGLTRATDVPASSYGAIIYNNPITLFDPITNTTSSFSTSFTFSITNLNPSSFGDGIAFFLSQSNTSLALPGAHLSLPNSSTHFVAVEFDTRLDARFQDPNENHVGLDIDTLESFKSVDPILHGIDLKSGNAITAWIDYKSEQNVLNVFLSYSSASKPLSPVLSVLVDLSKIFKNKVYVGSIFPLRVPLSLITFKIGVRFHEWIDHKPHL